MTNILVISFSIFVILKSFEYFKLGIRQIRIDKLREFYVPITGDFNEGDMIDDIEDGIGQIVKIDDIVNIPIIKYPHYPMAVAGCFENLTLVTKK